MKKTILGILAHVDAGKTTLSEALLYKSGKIRTLGRVDNKNAFFDNYKQERRRGITIFSKQAEIQFENLHVTLVDTPGHTDLAAEAERAIQIMDYGVLIIDGRKGVQEHTVVLANLLERYKVPFFIFVNKTDMEGFEKEKILNEIKEKITENAVDIFQLANPEMRSRTFEELAICDEYLMEEYISKEEISDEHIADAFENGKINLCYFGSALKLHGVDEFISGIEKYIKEKKYPEEFGARIYKISRDDKGNRLTFLKITGGEIVPKQAIYTGNTDEKINEIRIYSGDKYIQADRVEKGSLCAVTPLKNTFPGQGLGYEKNIFLSLEPALSYKVITPQGEDPKKVYLTISELTDEDPELSITWNEEKQEISVSFMGSIQKEILSEIIKERYSLDVTFGQKSIVYKEGIDEATGKIILFEPYYAFTITCPQNFSGKILQDIADMEGSFKPLEIADDISIIKGKAPVRSMAEYPETFYAFVKGQGSISLILEGYEPCSLEVQKAYEEEYGPLEDESENSCEDDYKGNYKEVSTGEDDELKKIFESTYGKPKDRTYIHKQTIRPIKKKVKTEKENIKEEYLLIDGYNVIHAWEDLKELAEVDMAGAREALCDIISNYAGYKKVNIIVVFDAYKNKGGLRHEENRTGIKVVFTKEGETADSYIEKFTYEMRGKALMRVATSDNLEQQIVTGNGAFLINAKDFRKEIDESGQKLREILAKYRREAEINTRRTIKF